MFTTRDFGSSFQRARFSYIIYIILRILYTIKLHMGIGASFEKLSKVLLLTSVRI